ncbi:MAG: c-type cytochrome [Candidatus Methylomirabilales bacterium]
MKRLQMFVAPIVALLLVGALAPSSFAAKKGDPKAGKKSFSTLCASCHGETGKGDGPAAATLPTKPKDLADAKHMNSLKDAYLFKVIKEGGASVGKSPLMPPWGSQLKDQDIWDVVAYIRTLAKSGK